MNDNPYMVVPDKIEGRYNHMLSCLGLSNQEVSLPQDMLELGDVLKEHDDETFVEALRNKYRPEGLGITGKAYSEAKRMFREIKSFYDECRGLNLENPLIVGVKRECRFPLNNTKAVARHDNMVYIYEGSRDTHIIYPTGDDIIVEGIEIAEYLDEVLLVSQEMSRKYDGVLLSIIDGRADFDNLLFYGSKSSGSYSPRGIDVIPKEGQIKMSFEDARAYGVIVLKAPKSNDPTSHTETVLGKHGIPIV